MQAITTAKAPQAIGPYSQAVKAGGLIFTSGQIALTSQGNLKDGDIRVQTTQVLENLKAVLEAAGASLDRVVKTTVFLQDMNDFQVMNEVYGNYLGHKPARSTVQAAKLPKDVLVEIDVIAEVK